MERWSDDWQPRYWNRTWLRREYLTRERTADAIASECGVGEATIRRWLDRYDLKREQH